MARLLSLTVKISNGAPVASQTLGVPCSTIKQLVPSASGAGSGISDPTVNTRVDYDNGFGIQQVYVTDTIAALVTASS